MLCGNGPKGLYTEIYIYLSIEIIAVFVVSLVQITVVRMLQCLFLTFSSLKLLLFCFMYSC